MTDAQRRIEKLLAELIDSGREIGAQVAAYRDGELVVHAWAGAAAPGVPVAADTLFPVFSVSKGVVATLLHLLVERGVFGYDTRIAEIWPDFGVHGKDTATLAHLLEHSAGVPFFPAGLCADDLLDQAAIAARIAAAKPAWTPGEKTGYHSLTFGYVAAELVRRGTGNTLGEAVRAELAEPLGLADELFLSPPGTVTHRLADVDGAAFGEFVRTVPADAPFVRAVGGIDVESIIPRREVPAGRSWAADAPLPFGLTMTARAGAALYGMLACGGEFGGVRLLPASRIALASTIRRREVDEILGEPALKSLGYAHGDPVSGGDESAFGFGGLGGAEVYADPAHRFSFAFTHNLLTEPTRPDSAPELAAELRNALGIA